MTLIPTAKIADAQAQTHRALKIVNARVKKAHEEWRYAVGFKAARAAHEEVLEAERVQEALQTALENLKVAIDAYERS